MRLFRPASLLPMMSVALLLSLAWFVVAGPFLRTSVGSETFAMRGYYTGVSFEWGSGPDTTVHCGGWQVKGRGWRPQMKGSQWRAQWGIQRDALRLGTTNVEVVQVSYSLLFAAAALPAVVGVVVAWRRPRRRVTGTCPGCAYDVRATPQRCPECGEVLRPPSLIDRVLSFDVVWLRHHLGRRPIKDVEAPSPPGNVQEEGATPPAS